MDLDRWPELQELTPEYLKDRYPHVQIPVYHSSIEQGPVAYKKQYLAEYIDDIQSAQTHERNPQDIYYLGESHDWVEALEIKQIFTNYMRPLLPRHAFALQTPFWLGPKGSKGSKTGLHAEPEGSNFLCQFYGEKEVVLVSPAHDHLIPRSTRFDAGGKTAIMDIWDPTQRENSPLLKETKPLVFHLKPGDILFIPRWWWHAAHNTTTSIAFSYRIETIGSAFLNIPSLCLIGLHNLGLYKNNNCTCHTPE